MIIRQKEVLETWIRENVEETNPISMVEIGVWKGHTTRWLCGRVTSRLSEYWAVDTWMSIEPRKCTITGKTLGYGRVGRKGSEWWEDTYRYVTSFMLWFPPLRVVRMSGDRFAAYCRKAGKQFDLVFLDADHYQDAVARDIKTWLPLIKPGGYLSGHDIYMKRHWGVTLAVKEAFGDDFIHIPDSQIWMVQK